MSTVSTERCSYCQSSCFLVAKDYWKQTEASTVYSGNSVMTVMAHSDHYGPDLVSGQ